MKSSLYLSACLCLLCILVSCNTTTPQKYFTTAVLNSNMLVGFANGGFERQLESPPAKAIIGQDMIVTMKSAQFLSSRIQMLEEDFAAIKNLNATGDAKNILQPAIAMYAFALPVYKNEYRQLADLYDDHASIEMIAALKQLIHDKYAAGFERLYQQLIASGKLYATKHDIKVNWNVGI